jgi:hypothetical protein
MARGELPEPIPGRSSFEPVRLYSEDDVRLPRRLSVFLQKKIDGYSETVLDGQCTPELYHELTGKIAGLKEALREAQELAKELEG